MTTTSGVGRLVLGVASFALALGLAELGLRLVARPAPPCAEPVGSAQTPVLRDVRDFARPDTRGVMTCNVPYRANRYGFRGPDVSEEKPPGVLRIALGGDSVTMGSGVAEEATYARRLEDLLDAEVPGRHQVLNLASRASPSGTSWTVTNPSACGSIPT